MTSTRDWVRWHDGYAEPDGDLARRLAHVQRRLGDALTEAPEGPIRLISLCAGEGRDVLGVLPSHPRRHDVTARLVELDPRNAKVAESGVSAAQLANVEVVTGDAAHITAYEGLIPADIVLACGIFGNVSDADIRKTIFALPQLTKPGARVLWTRSRRAPDLTPQIRTWFGEAGFDEVGFDHESDRLFSVGANVFRGVTAQFDPSTTLFEFVLHD